MPIPKTSPGPRRTLLRTVAAETIQEAILDGTLQPGEVLVDHELRSWLGMSRTPINDALTHLARIGLVELRAQRSTRVTDPDPEDHAALQRSLATVLCGLAHLELAAMRENDVLAICRAAERALAKAQQRAAEAHQHAVWDMARRMMAASRRSPLTESMSDVVDVYCYKLVVLQPRVDVRWERRIESLSELVRALSEVDGQAVAAAIAGLSQ